jgi:hypothetical protein
VTAYLQDISLPSESEVVPDEEASPTLFD